MPAAPETAPLFGCVEAGGTKFVLGVAAAPDDIRVIHRIPTEDPTTTIAAMLAFFREQEAAHGPLAGFGVASFGPVQLDRTAPDWGHILATPKPGWTGTDLVGPLRAAFGRPVGFDTDVNGAILAESLWGAAQGASVATYVTVGTGIGGGVVIDGRTLHGARHPEMGHMLAQRHPDDHFPGTCPFHGSCMEGLANGPSIKARWGVSLSDLPADHPAHGIIAFYLAQLVLAQQAMLSPARIVLGGGVLATPHLLARIRTEAARLAAGYFGTADYATLVTAPALGDNAGLLGALALAIATDCD